MSKVENGFALIRLRATREAEKALHRACEWIATECEYCPLANKEKCALKQLPPGFKDQIEDDPTICQDWLTLYFRTEMNENDKS